MVFESILKPKEAERHPLEVFLYAIVVTSVSIWVAYFVFPAIASHLFLFLIAIATIPMIFRLLQEEEEYAEKYSITERSFLQEHMRVIKVYTYFFLGVLVAASLWYTFLPQKLSDILFDAQIRETARLGAAVSGVGDFLAIFFNNAKVALIAFVMSFFYGTGAIWVLSWNASVIAVWVGKAARAIAAPGIAGASAAYAYALPTSLLKIALHGIPEILAYFFAGIGGGILTVGMLRGKHDSKIIADAFLLFGIAIGLLALGAALETWVTPAIR